MTLPPIGPDLFDGLKRRPTPDEQVFAEELTKLVPDVQVWLHNDPDGTPWMMISYDVMREAGGVAATLRLDFDAHAIIASLSPSALNWDDGVRAREAGITGERPDELNLSTDKEPLPKLAERAAQWFSGRIKSGY